MSDMYAIKTTTLTALGDAVRDKTGKETRIETYFNPKVLIAKTSNATKSGSTVQFSMGLTNYCSGITQEGATSLKVKLYYATKAIPYSSGGFCYLRVAAGKYTQTTFPTAEEKYTQYNSSVDKKVETVEFILENTDSVTFYFSAYTTNYGCGCYAEVYGLDANGELMLDDEELTKEVPNTLTPLQMVEEINNMPATPTAEELIITGSCKYRFSNGGWDWFIEKYGDMITTKNITDGDYMFYYFSGPEIPFDINFDTTKTYHNCDYLFGSCYNISSIPKINGMIANDIGNMFSSCQSLRELDYESVKNIDWSYMDKQTSAYSAGREGTFTSCFSLRSFPMEFLNHGNPVSVNSGSIFYNLFNNCYALDEVIDLPNPHSTPSWTSNAFYNTVSNCFRLKNLTFALKDGAPYVCSKWKNQAIDLSKNTGWVTSGSLMTNYNSGITADKQVTDDASYQALKNDPDWFSINVAYSRYNHDSAVATINTLPDCSALGGNTIKFKGDAGSKTDGGAINTLTEEEIAVATAKGWTVSFV